MQSSVRLLPVLEASVQAGFPSPAEGHVEGRIDLTDYLVLHPAATFLMWVSGNSMTGAGIYDGDLLVVDRAITPAPGHVVVAAIDGELTLKRLAKRGKRMVLEAENPDFPVIELSEDNETLIWGVATSAVHFLAAAPPRGQAELAAE